MFAGEFAGAGSLHEVAQAARSAPPPAGSPRPPDLLLDGLAVLITEGHAKAAPLLRGATRAFAEEEITVEEGLRWGWLAAAAAAMVWDDDYWYENPARQLQSVRENGLLVHLPLWVQGAGLLAAWRGDFTEAASLGAEAEAIAAATGTGFARYGALFLAALRGAEPEARQLIEAETADARAAGQGLGMHFARWVSAILDNGLGRYQAAVDEAQQAADEAPELFVSMWALPELIEAASRTGQTRLAADALGRLSEATGAHQTDWAQGDLGAFPCGAERRPGHRGRVSRGRRPVGPHQLASRARPRSPAVR